MRHFGGHADAFAQGRVSMDGFADVGGVATHFDGQADFANMSPAWVPTIAPPIT